MIERLLKGVLTKWISKSRKYVLFFYFLLPLNLGENLNRLLEMLLILVIPKAKSLVPLVALIGSPMKENLDLN